MIEGAALFYSLLASFILSSSQRNRKLNRPHPPILFYAGYILVGISIGAAALLALVAVRPLLG